MKVISWNPKAKLFLADVDETAADIYKDATPGMIRGLSELLSEGKGLFFVTGGGIGRVQRNVIDHIPQPLRRRIIVAHCSGAEVLGFNPDGTPKAQPYYSLYDQAFTTDSSKERWREIIQTIVKDFDLKTHPAMSIQQFFELTKGDPLAIMLDDRGPQITFEMPNSWDLSEEQIASHRDRLRQELHGHTDLRAPIMERADELLKAAGLPVHPEFGGMFALDFKLQGVDKKRAIHFVLDNDEALASLGTTKDELQDPEHLEVWGDKFSTAKGGSDRKMIEAVTPGVRAIDFRPEEEGEVGSEFNIVLWNGEKRLHNGLEEYLSSRNQN